VTHTFLVLAGTVVLAAVMTLPARAQESAGIVRCQSIRDNTERLSCYDRITDPAQQAAPAMASDYQAMNLTDLKLDQESLRNHKVAVSGNLLVAGEMALLRSSNSDLSPLVVDAKGVPREQRRTMLERCGASGCTVMVRGRVDRVMAQPSIVAESLEVQ